MTRHAIVILGALGSVLLPSLAAAQGARVYGTITDETGASLPALTVMATTQGGGREMMLRVKTDRYGAYEHADLPVGSWSLRAEFPGFGTRSTTVALAPGESVDWSASLRIGEVEETVTVSRGDTPRRLTRRSAPPSAAVARTAASRGSVGGRITPPTKILDGRPSYPVHLATSGIGGRVRLRAVIATNGLVSSVEATAGANAELVTAATNALRAWEFTPMLLNGLAVETRIRATFTFAP